MCSFVACFFASVIPLLFNVTVNKYTSLIRGNKIKQYKLDVRANILAGVKILVRVKILRTDGRISKDEFMRGGGYRNKELYRPDLDLSKSSFKNARNSGKTE